jgi:hypothetical protein
MSAAPSSRAQRRRDTEDRLTHDTDVWVVSASADGAPYLVPLSFDWEDEGAGGGHALPLVPHLTARHPGLARGERAADRELMRDDRWLV